MVWLSDFGANTLVRFDNDREDGNHASGSREHRVQQQAYR
jgi:streptogramin lyase